MLNLEFDECDQKTIDMAMRVRNILLDLRATNNFTMDAFTSGWLTDSANILQQLEKACVYDGCVLFEMRCKFSPLAGVRVINGGDVHFVLPNPSENLPQLLEATSSDDLLKESIVAYVKSF